MFVAAVGVVSALIYGGGMVLGFIARRWLLATAAAGVAYVYHRSGREEREAESRANWPEYFPEVVSGHLMPIEGKGWRETEPTFWTRTNDFDSQRFWRNDMLGDELMCYRLEDGAGTMAVVGETSRGYLFGEFDFEDGARYRLRRVVVLDDNSAWDDVEMSIPQWVLDSIGAAGPEEAQDLYLRWGKTLVAVVALLYLVGRSKNEKVLALGLVALFVVLRQKRI